MNLSELTTEVRTRINETTADFFGTAEVTNAINEAITRFCQEERWSFLLTEWETTLAANVNSIALPNDVSLTRVFNIAATGGNLAFGRMVERVDPTEGFELRHQYEGRTSSPRWYYIAYSNLGTDDQPPTIYTARFIPTPDVDYTIEAQYMAAPIALSGDQDIPMVPSEYQEAIVAWASGKLFLKELSISQKASEQFSIYRTVLNQARKDLKTFSLDETVAWGRKEPLRGYWSQSVYDRIPPTLG